LPRRPLILSGLAAACLLAAPVQAQQNDSQDSPVAEAPVRRDLRVRPILTAARRAGEIRIDGRIDDAAWSAAPLATGFVQAEPDEGVPATHDTQVRMLIDDDAIYVAARMLEAHPDSIGRLLVRRDEHGPYFDWFGFQVDPNLDGRTAYSFRVSPQNSQADYLVTDDQFGGAWRCAFRSPRSAIRRARERARGASSSRGAA
jgi:hypothetical protein